MLTTCPSSLRPGGVDTPAPRAYSIELGIRSMRAHRSRQMFAVLLALVVASCAMSCASSPKKRDPRQPVMVRHEFTHPALGRSFRIVVYCDDAAAAARAEGVVIRRMAELEEILDDREDLRPGSE